MNSHDYTYLDYIKQRLVDLEKLPPNDKIQILIELNMFVIGCLDQVEEQYKDIRKILIDLYNAKQIWGRPRNKGISG